MFAQNLGTMLIQNCWNNIISYRYVKIFCKLYIEFTLQDNLKVHIPLDSMNKPTHNWGDFKFLNFYAFDYNLKQFQIILSSEKNPICPLNVENTLKDQRFFEITENEENQLRLTGELKI